MYPMHNLQPFLTLPISKHVFFKLFFLLNFTIVFPAAGLQSDRTRMDQTLAAFQVISCIKPTVIRTVDYNYTPTPHFPYQPGPHYITASPWGQLSD